MTKIFLQLKIITTKSLQQAIVWQSSYAAVRNFWPKIKVGILKKKTWQWTSLAQVKTKQQKQKSTLHTSGREAATNKK